MSKKPIVLHQKDYQLGQDLNSGQKKGKKLFLGAKLTRPQGNLIMTNSKLYQNDSEESSEGW